MYEFEIEFLDTQERHFYYGYSVGDLEAKYPMLQRRPYHIAWYEYID